MASGELNLQHSTTSPQAQPPAPGAGELPPLPAALQNAGKSLAKALKEDAQVAQAFATFCSAAYVKPDWAGTASEFLEELFAEHEDLLAEMARIPDLIIELASGHVTLTCMVAARWAARGETHRLARLAEALIATQSKMSGTAAVVEVMLALTTSLAITRYSRAEQLLHAAEPQVTEDQQEALAEARLWLAGGRIVRGCSQEVRDLWDQRLRRSRQAWTWESAEERDALLQLADHVEEGLEGLSLFQTVVPSAWWDLASMRHRERTEAAQPPPPANPQPILISNLRLPQSFGAEAEHDNLPNLPWNPRPFLAGTVLGAMSLTFFIWLAQPRWISRSHRPPTTAQTLTVTAPPPVAKAASESAKASDSDSKQELHLIPPTEATPAAPAADTAPAPNKEMDKEKDSAAVSSPPAAPEARGQPDPEWRAAALKDLAVEEPDLAPLTATAKRGTWAENELNLKGGSVVAPLATSRYQKLLFWLHLDPPEDPEVRAKIPALLAELRADDPVLDLWKRLIYDGSPNAADIRNAAKQQIHNNADAWTPAQRKVLMDIAGWGGTGTASAP